ncbi:MAG: BlaI/MecI/CopY family transcriptional regulator [Tepidisphaerales bacterium]
MPGKPMFRPTAGELEILQVLWQSGPSTVRQVHQALAPKRTSYNTTLKLLQIMHEKAMVLRDDSRRPQVFRAAVPEKQTQRHLFTDFLQRAFGGSARKLLAAMADSDIPQEEVAQIRQLLDKMQEK